MEDPNDYYGDKAWNLRRERKNLNDTLDSETQNVRPSELLKGVTGPGQSAMIRALMARYETAAETTPTTHEGKAEKPKTEEEMDQFDAALDLLRRLDPKNTSTHLQNLITLCPSLTEDLLTSVDQPLTIRRCKTSGRDYLICDYNRDGDSYRSPWSNEFDPPLEVESELGEGSMPNERVRRMEVAANEAFDVYRELYYEGGVSSAYFWNLDDGFAGVVLIKKAASPGLNSTGVWDSIHVFEATDRARACHYKLTSTVILHLSSTSSDLGEMDLSGNMTRQIEQDMAIEDDSSHIANIGRMVEDMELKMRNLLQEVYFGKAKDVVGDLRSLQNLEGVGKERDMQREMISAMKK